MSHYTARFVPQAWVRDNAIEVDPEGDTEWDVTDAFGRLPDEYRTAMIEEIKQDGESLDNWDALKGDPNAPEWVREWHGPFSLYVRQSRPSYDELLQAFREYVESTSIDNGVPGLRTNIAPAVTIADVIHKADRKAWEADIERAWDVIEAAGSPE